MEGHSKRKEKEKDSWKEDADCDGEDGHRRMNTGKDDHSVQVGGGVIMTTIPE